MPDLTDVQVENWRKVLVGMIGPAALTLPKEEIQNLRDKFQEIANKLPDTPEED